MLKIMRFLAIFSFAILLSGCATTAKWVDGDFPGPKTYSEKQVRTLLPAVTDYRQLDVSLPGAKTEPSGIWVPKRMDQDKGGSYTFLVVMSGNASREDLFGKETTIKELFPGIVITKAEDLETSAYYPQGNLSRLDIRYALNGRALKGEVLNVVLPPKAVTITIPLPVKRHK